MTKASDAYLDSLARAYFKTGNSAGALETEEKVFPLLSSSEKVVSATRKEYEANLAKFKRARR